MKFDKYLRIFLASARELNGDDLARQWWRAGVEPTEAARWANDGYDYRKARPRIARGVTGEQALAETAELIAAWTSC